MNSSRTGCASPAGKMSTMPPRTANSPCSSAGSSRVKPASTSSSARSVGAMSCPGLSSSDAPAAARARSRAAAAPPPTRRRRARCPVPMACSARARAEVTPMCGARPRYGSTSCEGNGSTARSAAVAGQPFERREEEARRRRPSARGRRRSARRTARRRAGSAVRGAGHEQRLRRRRQPRDDARRTFHPAARDRGLEQRPQVQRGRRVTDRARIETPTDLNLQSDRESLSPST